MASKAYSTYNGLNVHRHTQSAVTLYEVKDASGKFLGHVAKQRLEEHYRVLGDPLKRHFETRNKALDSLLS